MSQVSVVRILLMIGGLAAIALSFALQVGYAADVALSGPGTTAIIAMAGVFTIALSLIRRRRK